MSFLTTYWKRYTKSTNMAVFHYWLQTFPTNHRFFSLNFDVRAPVWSILGSWSLFTNLFDLKCSVSSSPYRHDPTVIAQSSHCGGQAVSDLLRCSIAMSQSILMKRGRLSEWLCRRMVIGPWTKTQRIGPVRLVQFPCYQRPIVLIVPKCLPAAINLGLCHFRQVDELE